ncbi:sensor histidine kinase [Rufibacter roseus]|uniref:histidine kinase n=1 Tax=Rufibacter roseus TaxID=1567108 RepID=A0ABW2DUE7_9BACT|nr:HAMP domain-containing sensor histidine kinase [Rufibacter roseus]
MGGSIVGKTFTSIQVAWADLIGPVDKFLLEHRVYNTFCLITIIAVGYNIPFNYAVGLYWSSFLSAFMMVVLATSYYLSRFRQKHQTSFVLSAATVTAVFGINYFFNAGINGPTLLLLALSYFPIMAVAPASQRWLWTSANIILMVALMVIEFLYPQSVSGHYTTRESQFVDMASSYMIVFILIRVCTVYLVKSYNAARFASEQAALELQYLNQDKNKLFSIVSHDLRAPLSNIKGYLEILATSDLPNHRRSEIEKHLLVATQNTLEMLTNLLAWSKNQMEGAEKEFIPLQVRPLLAPTLELFSDIARGKGITIENHISPDIAVTADPDMLQLIFRNLVNNAIKFTALGGQITLGSETVGQSAIFTVTDSGTGTPVSLKSDIFLLKGHRTYGTKSEKGVGLGLVLCREFTEALQGSIWFENHPHSGTTFYLRLPLALNFTTPAVPVQELVKV